MYVIEYKGKDIKLTEYCKMKGLNYNYVLNYMYRYELDVEEAVRTYGEKRKTLGDICKERGVSYGAVTQYKFHHKDKSYEEIIELYEKKKGRINLKEFCRERKIEKEYTRICLYKYKHRCSIEEAVEKVTGIKIEAAAGKKKKEKV